MGILLTTTFPEVFTEIFADGHKDEHKSEMNSEDSYKSKMKEIIDKINDDDCSFPFYITPSNDSDINRHIINNLTRRGYDVSYSAITHGNGPTERVIKIDNPYLNDGETSIPHASFIAKSNRTHIVGTMR